MEHITCDCGETMDHIYTIDGSIYINEIYKCKCDKTKVRYVEFDDKGEIVSEEVNEI